MSKPKPVTPMMAQYRRIKSELPSDSILFFRLGDFYEMFFEDAQVAAEILEVSLTKRGVIPMCGIPFHAAGSYLGKLLRAGKKVAICDQVEEARPGKLVKREVTQVISPGTHFDDSILQAAQNNYLVAVVRDGERIGLSSVDLTTGEFGATELPFSQLQAELERLKPAEIVCPEGDSKLIERFSQESWSLSPYEDWVFGLDSAEFTLKEQADVLSLDGFGLRGKERAIAAAGGIIHYLSQHLRRDLKHLRTVEYYERSEFLVLDMITLKNLEVLEPLHRDAPKTASLFGALNLTVTPMGARCLRQWISQPLAQISPILDRQTVVASWIECPEFLEQFRVLLKNVRDLERTMSRLSLGTGNGRDLLTVKCGLEEVPRLKEILIHLCEEVAVNKKALFQSGEGESEVKVEFLQRLIDSLDPLPDLTDLISRALMDEAPITVRDGGMIRDGYDPKLDELRSAGSEGKNWIAGLQRDEAARTGITSLKVRFNSVFGYFIEVTRSNLDKVPEHYIRKQTIANGERFITPELKEVEGKILGAEERAQKLEYELFQQVRDAVVEKLSEIQTCAAAVAQLDVLASFAECARLHDYCRPVIVEDGALEIEAGRHPVLDLALSGERFVPNDTSIGGDEAQIAIITGPNMAGKSTFIRQVALLALLSHTGSFIPAKEARVGLMDRIFTRIGASDDLARGQSTFMVEMSETANILNNASSRSLVILDEVGRGTSTFDGLSLAWSIVEHLHNQIGAKTLFATHYHELTELSSLLERVSNYRVAVKEWDDQIIFVRKIIPGGADKSYGIQVARLAGIPKPVLDRAKGILERLERSDLSPTGPNPNPQKSRPERAKLRELEPPPQLDLFS
ncbi:DNA mismatch repair protein MutS [Verrucomicrobia bacterium]|nr:DNA mismatch repair protein MutS [Verrucomicrobiota bacterium]MDB4746397.1 DNA mismatch repair protein MutS [Verrucomicrobiota bacterium]